MRLDFGVDGECGWQGELAAITLMPPHALIAAMMLVTRCRSPGWASAPGKLHSKAHAVEVDAQADLDAREL